MDLRESLPLLFGPLGAPQTQTLPFEFVEQHYDAILAKIPGNEIFNAGAFLPFVGSGFCDDQGAKRVAAFFEPKVARFNGAPRNLAQTLETIRLCVAYKDAQESSVAAFLKKY
jgi:ERAP1-like C-terminal domain